MTVGVVKRRPKSAFTGKNLCFARYVNKAQEDHAAEESHFYRAERYILQMDVAGLTSSDWCLVETFIQTRGQQSFLAKNAGKVLGRTKTRFCVPSVAFGFMQHASICHSAFKYLLDRPTIDWICPICSLPPLSDSFFEEMDGFVTEEENYLNRSLLESNANYFESNLSPLPQETDNFNSDCFHAHDVPVQEKKKHANQLLACAHYDFASL